VATPEYEKSYEEIKNGGESEVARRRASEKDSQEEVLQRVEGRTDNVWKFPTFAGGGTSLETIGKGERAGYEWRKKGAC
jgi:hypothetical protein